MCPQYLVWGRKFRPRQKGDPKAHGGGPWTIKMTELSAWPGLPQGSHRCFCPLRARKAAAHIHTSRSQRASRLCPNSSFGGAVLSTPSNMTSQGISTSHSCSKWSGFPSASDEEMGTATVKLPACLKSIFLCEFPNVNQLNFKTTL